MVSSSPNGLFPLLHGAGGVACRFNRVQVQLISSSFSYKLQRSRRGFMGARPRVRYYGGEESATISPQACSSEVVVVRRETIV
jgi:hypothetical protein